VRPARFAIVIAYYEYGSVTTISFTPKETGSLQVHDGHDDAYTAEFNAFLPLFDAVEQALPPMAAEEEISEDAPSPI
jgi:hypothetical protein